MKKLLLILLAATFFATNLYSQCDHITRGITEIWGDFPIFYGKYLNDYDTTTGLMLDLTDKKIKNIYIDLQGSNFKLDKPKILVLKVKFYKHSIPNNVNDNANAANIKISTSDNNVDYDSLIQGRLPAKEFSFAKRFLELSFFTVYEPYWTQRTTFLDSIFISEIMIWQDNFAGTIEQIGNYAKVGDTVKLKAILPKEYLSDYTITWFSTTLPTSGVVGDSIFATSPGKYYYKYENAKWWCNEYSDTIEVIKNVNSVEDFNSESLDRIYYYDYLGNKINNIDSFFGVYLEVRLRNNKIMTTRKLIKY